MPRGDRTGPRGMGSRTGRGAGYCSGVGAPGYTNPAAGRGAGMGFGRNAGAWGGGYGGGGRGQRNMFFATGVPGWRRFGGYDAPYGYPPATYQTADPDVEKQSLKRQAELLESELEAVKKRLAEVEAGKSVV